MAAGCCVSGLSSAVLACLRDPWLYCVVVETAYVRKIRAVGFEMAGLRDQRVTTR